MGKYERLINVIDVIPDEQALIAVGAAVVSLWEELCEEDRRLIMDATGRTGGLGLRIPADAQKRFKRLIKNSA